MKGFIGTANIDTNSRLCMASAVAGSQARVRRGCGAGLLRGLRSRGPDRARGLEHGVVPSGALPAHRAREGAAARAEDRRDRSAPHADVRHRRSASADARRQRRVAVRRPAGVPACARMHGYGASSPSTRSAATEALAVALRNGRAMSSEVAAACGVDADRIREFYQLFARTERVVTAFSQGVNQSSAGTDKVNSIINCHLLTGRIGRPGMGPFSITGQPNAMGGREAGGMANMLAAHMELENAAHRRDRADVLEQPAHRRARRAQSGRAVRCDSRRAHQGGLDHGHESGREPAGCRIACARRCSGASSWWCRTAWRARTRSISRMCACPPRRGARRTAPSRTPSGASRASARSCRRPARRSPDWWMISEVAKRMGFGAGFSSSRRATFSSSTRACRARTTTARARSTSAASRSHARGIRRRSRRSSGRCAVARTHAVGQRSGATIGTARSADASFTPMAKRASWRRRRARRRMRRAKTFPLVLNTGRIRDQWHTMTRTGRAPRLADHLPEPFVDMHAQDALLAGVRDGELARVTTQWGSMAARLRTSGEIARGAVFVPIHWSAANSSDARVGALVNPVVDADFRRAGVQAHAGARRASARRLVRRALHPRRASPSRIRRGGRECAAMASPLRARGPPRAVRRRAADAPRSGRGDSSTLRDVAGADYLDYEDAAAASIAARYSSTIASSPALSSRRPAASLTHLARQPVRQSTTRRHRSPRAARRPPLKQAPTPAHSSAAASASARNTITDAIARHRLTTPAQVGERLKAGTNCGSCVPEIRQLLGNARQLQNS